MAGYYKEGKEMEKVTLIIRKGVPANLKESIDKIIGDVQQQNGVFITDLKSHSIDFLVENGSDWEAVLKRIQGSCGLSILRQQYNQGGNFVVLGKMMDSEVSGTIAERGAKLF